MILGETQILGQVRTAFAQAQEAGTAGKYLSLLFRCALHVGKRARSETAIAQGAASVSTATLEIVRNSLGTPTGKHLALVGSGEVGSLVASCLSDAGYSRFTVISRNIANAQRLAQEYEGAVALEFQALDQLLVEADLIITTLESPVAVINRERTATALDQRQGKELFLIDLAVPRNIVPEVGDLAGVTLYNLDDLQTVIHSHLEQRQQEMEHIEEILAGELTEFCEHWRAAQVAPLIKALNQKVEQIRREEFDRVLPDLQHLSEQEIHSVQDLTTRIVKRLLHAPLVGLRSEEDAGRIAFVGQLFMITPEEA
jgi:glutamyl-tRNA reductase